MLPRFEGDSGQKKLAEVLRRQALIAGNAVVAETIAARASLVELMPQTPDAQVIVQGGADNDIYFIISGTVVVTINGREVARRSAGAHVGEMSLLDPTARRSATVTAVEPCLLARLGESHFAELAQQHPDLWRNIGVELANRLRERTRLIRPPHNQPVLLIGSSSEQLDIAKEIQLGLSREPMVVTVWTDGIFKASKTSIESLLTAVSDADFAVLVISPDDHLESRGTHYEAPRDNVLFELGLFMGGLSRERTFIVKPRSQDIKIPTDLLGICPIEYTTGDCTTITARLAPVCTELCRTILRIGAR